MTGTTFAAPPHRFEAGTPMIAEAVGLGVGRRLSHCARHAERARPRTRIGALRLGRLGWRPGASDHRTGRALSTGERRSRSRCQGSIRTMSPSCSTSGGSRCAPAITARVRCACATAYRPPRERRSASTPRPRRSMHSSRDIEARVCKETVVGERCLVPLDSMYQQIILDHYKHPHHRGAHRGFRRRGASRQSDVR